MNTRYPPHQQYDASQQAQPNHPPRPQTAGAQQQNAAAQGVQNPFAFSQGNASRPAQPQPQARNDTSQQLAAQMEQTNMMNAPRPQTGTAKPNANFNGAPSQPFGQVQQPLPNTAINSQPSQLGINQQNSANQAPFEGESLDHLNSDKSLLRVTTDRVPSTGQLAKDCGIPLAIVVKPFGALPSGEEIPQSNFAGKPIVRCKECRAYINPFVRFVENGTKWICNFCKDVNNTESYYYSATDINGQRLDIDNRPELAYGSIDFIASKDYQNRPPMPPTFVFVFDVSQPAIESGYLAQAAQTIKGIIEEGTLPDGERTRVCFLAYDKNLYFFNLRSTLKQPQMMTIPEATDPFLPQPDDLLVNLSESFDLVTNLLDSLELYFSDSMAPKTQESQFIGALQSANSLAKHIGGKMILFQVSPSVAAHPMLQAKAGSTNDVHARFSSSNPYFANTASELAHAQISADVFVFTQGNGQFKNLHTLGDLAKKSNGSLFFYPNFDAYSQGMKFSNDLYTCLTRSHAWESVFRVRTSAGFNQIGTYGNILIKQRTQDLILCPSIDKDRVIVYELERQTDSQLPVEKRVVLSDQKHLYIQSALLYSSQDGERRIRVHNAAIALTNIKNLPFEYIDSTALTLFWARNTLTRLSINQHNFTSVQNQLEMSLQILCRAQARLSQGTDTAPQPGQLPELLQYLVLYVFGLLKSCVVSPLVAQSSNPYLDMVADVSFQVNVMSPEEVLPMFHPQIYSISDPNITDTEFPAMEMLQRQTLTSDKIFICFNAQIVGLFVGSQADTSLISALFKVFSFQEINKGMTEEQIFEDVESSPYLTAVYSLINQVRYQKQTFCELKVILEGDREGETILRQMCILDAAASPVYKKEYSKFVQEMSPPQSMGGHSSQAHPAAQYAQQQQYQQQAPNQRRN